MEHQTPTRGLFRLDLNGDRRVSLEEVAGWFAHLLFLPGDLAIELLLSVPALASFLDLGPSSYGGVASKTVSILFWIAALLICGAVWSKLRDLDRELTAWIAGRWEAGVRMLRVQRRLISSWIGMHLQRRRQHEEAITVTEFVLPQLEARVLGCYSGIKDARMLAAAEVSSMLGISMANTQKALLSLVRYRFVQVADDTDESAPVFEITRAGQVYLLEH